MIAFSVSFFITILNFYILYWILRRFLWKPVKGLLEKREAKVKAELADAALAKGSAEELRSRYEEMLSGAEVEAERVLREASDQADHEAKGLVSGARTEAEALMRRAEEAAAKEREAVFEALTGDIAKLAAAVGARLAAREPAEADRAAAEALVRELGRSDGR